MNNLISKSNKAILEGINLTDDKGPQGVAPSRKTFRA